MNFISQLFPLLFCLVAGFFLAFSLEVSINWHTFFILTISAHFSSFFLNPNMTHIPCHYTLHFPPMQNLKVTQAKKGEKNSQHMSLLFHLCELSLYSAITICFIQLCRSFDFLVHLTFPDDEYAVRQADLHLTRIKSLSFICSE